MVFYLINYNSLNATDLCTRGCIHSGSRWPSGYSCGCPEDHRGWTDTHWYLPHSEDPHNLAGSYIHIHLSFLHRCPHGNRHQQSSLVHQVHTASPSFLVDKSRWSYRPGRGISHHWCKDCERNHPRFSHSCLPRTPSYTDTSILQFYPYTWRHSDKVPTDIRQHLFRNSFPGNHGDTYSCESCLYYGRFPHFGTVERLILLKK